MAISEETLTVIGRLRASTGYGVDQVTQDLSTAWARAWNEVADEWEAAIGDLIAARTNGAWPTATQVRRAERAAKALAATRDLLADLAGTVPLRVGDGLPELLEQVAELTRAVVATQFPVQAGGTASVAAGLDRVSKDEITAIVDRVSTRVTALSLPITARTDAAIRSVLIRGVALGMHPDAAARLMVSRVRGSFDLGLARARNIARTEMLDAHRTAERAQQDRSKDVLTGWTWLATLDHRTCESCLAMHGSEHPLTVAGPLGHQQCVLPGAVVSGPRAFASTTRRYSGEVIDIETRSGRILSVTENHPILTPHGWVPAGLLREGDYVVASTRADGPPAGGSPDDNQVPAFIEDVAQTLGGSLPVDAVSVPTSPEDFHGDGAGSEVHVVRANGLLRRHLEATGSQGLGQLLLMVGDVSLEALTGGGRLDLLLDRLGPSSRRLVSGRHDAAVLLGGARGGHGAVGLGGPSPRHTCGIESLVDGSTRYSERFGQGVDGLPGEVSGDDLGVGQINLRHTDLGAREGIAGGLVAPGSTLLEDPPQSTLAYPMPSRDDLAAFAGEVVTDSIVDVRRRRWEGHVYNLQTGTGWYIANGILTHNCRCDRLPILKPWKDLGYAIPEPESLLPDARAWFDRQPESVQISIMGERKLALLRSGRIGWDDLAMRRRNPGWRPSYAPRPLKDLERLAAARDAA